MPTITRVRPSSTGRTGVTTITSPTRRKDVTVAAKASQPTPKPRLNLAGRGTLLESPDATLWAAAGRRGGLHAVLAVCYRVAGFEQCAHGGDTRGGSISQHGDKFSVDRICIVAYMHAPKRGKRNRRWRCTECGETEWSERRYKEHVNKGCRGPDRRFRPAVQEAQASAALSSQLTDASAASTDVSSELACPGCSSLRPRPSTTSTGALRLRHCVLVLACLRSVSVASQVRQPAISTMGRVALSQRLLPSRRGLRSGRKQCRQAAARTTAFAAARTPNPVAARTVLDWCRHRQAAQDVQLLQGQMVTQRNLPQTARGSTGRRPRAATRSQPHSRLLGSQRLHGSTAQPSLHRGAACCGRGGCF